VEEKLGGWESMGEEREEKTMAKKRKKVSNPIKQDLVSLSALELLLCFLTAFSGGVRTCSFFLQGL
jgi:hypothetical protein